MLQNNYRVYPADCGCFSSNWSLSLNWLQTLKTTPYLPMTRIQDLAIRCIQKNIKKNRGVKGWPWWKLFTTVRPLIEVQLTEEQIRGKDEEIQQLKGKLEKVEKERNELRLNSDRLESRITELSAELADERNTGESASQLLETETSERLRLEKDMKELQWRLKYERAIRETEFTKKRLQQECDDKVEAEQQSKRQLERRLTDLQADNEEVQRSVQQLKKKFDSELSQAQDEVQRERTLKEKLCREKDILTGEVFSLRQQLEDKDMEMCAVNLKVEQLEAELQDLSSQESKDEASLAKVKKQLRDLEAKVKDQEEELDEQAGTIQMLEQAKLRLEMEMERLRQTHSKEIESKDEEVEEIRQSCSKKLKQMEVQLEEEYDDKQKVLRERRDLESKLLTAQDQVSQRDVETEKRLKKDLKRTKVLLADAQIIRTQDYAMKKDLSEMSEEHVSLISPTLSLIAVSDHPPPPPHLQLEESEFTCAAAVKSRKAMEVEIEDLHIQMDDISKAKISLEEQVSRLQREKNDLQSRLEEDQEDMNELMKKHKAAVSQLEEALKEKQEIQEKLQSLQSQLDFQEQSMVEKSLVSRQEAKIRELDTKLEFERTQVKRLEGLVSRLKENLEKLTEERDHRSSGENREKEQNKRMQRQIRDIKEEMVELAKKEAEASRKKHELEMDIESLEAANQSLQSDLKLAFKRIGDLQAAIEDEMESDDNDDLINRNAANADVKETKEGKEGKEWKENNKEGKEVEQTRPVSVMSSLSYRKRSNLKDSIGGAGDESSLFSTLKEHSDSQDRSSFRKAKSKSADGQDDALSVSSWKKSQAGDDLDDRGSIISQAYSEATSRARKGLERRWANQDFDKESTMSSVAPSRASTARRGLGLGLDDDAMSTLSGLGPSSPRNLRRSASWLDDGRSDSYAPSLSPGLSRRSGGRSPGSVSQCSLARSSRLSEFGIDDDGLSVAFSESRAGSSAYSPRSVGRSFSMPPQARSSEDSPPDAANSDIKPVSHRNYLDPDLEAAINEVLSFKPIKFKRRSLEDSDGEEEEDEEAKEKGEGDKSDEEDGRRSVRSVKSSQGGESSSWRSGSTLDYTRPTSSASSRGGDEDETGAPGEERPPSKREQKQKKKKVDNLMMKYLYRPDSD
ncbi:hypothetical protein JZ751_019185 [Albula glossodonta]|uniref:Myosin tail domain-containing protein n=1 Tax=Albula glossodonta TaxID=121402 RepID=A0A8T2NV29_9TELE|nr:hypothetical protein JZ751_019185 [Albula glossodonta]